MSGWKGIRPWRQGKEFNLDYPDFTISSFPPLLSWCFVLYHYMSPTGNALVFGKNCCPNILIVFFLSYAEFCCGVHTSTQVYDRMKRWPLYYRAKCRSRGNTKCDESVGGKKSDDSRLKR